MIAYVRTTRLLYFMYDLAQVLSVRILTCFPLATFWKLFMAYSITRSSSTLVFFFFLCFIPSSSCLRWWTHNTPTTRLSGIFCYFNGGFISVLIIERFVHTLNSTSLVLFRFLLTTGSWFQNSPFVLKERLLFPFPVVYNTEDPTVLQGKLNPLVSDLY